MNKNRSTWSASNNNSHGFTEKVARPGPSSHENRSGKKLGQVILKNETGDFIGYADLIQRFALLFEDVRVPSTRKIRRIGAKEQALGAGDIQSAAEYGAKIQVRFFIAHPAIAARSIQIYVRA